MSRYYVSLQKHMGTINKLRSREGGRILKIRNKNLLLRIGSSEGDTFKIRLEKIQSKI